jgi:integrase
MTKRKLPHLQHERTRHGLFKWYVRKERGKRIRIKGEYGSPQFMADYHAAIAGADLPSAKPDKKRASVGTLKWLVDQWHASADWAQSSPATRRQRENILLHVLAKSGNVSFKAITKKHIMEARDRRAKTPFAANNFLKTMRALFRWAVEMEHLEVDPTLTVKRLSVKTDGFKVWTPEEVARYRKRWPLGTRERLAMEILLNTGLRRSDAVRLGRQHVKDGVIEMKADKTNTELFIPVMPELQAAIDAGPCGDLTFVVTASGAPFVKESFGTWFKNACKAAKVEGTAHGLRKLLATQVADSGGSEKELQAFFGWRTGSQSQTYTRAANNRSLAQRAAQRLARKS